MHPMAAAPHLVGERLGRRRLRVGVRHFEDGRHPAHDGGAGAGLQIFLVLQAGLAEVDLRVDDARQDMQAPAVDRAPGGGSRQVADGGGHARVDPDVPLAPAVLIDDDAALEHEVEGLGHGQHLLAPPSGMTGVRALSPHL